jgi:hypothetical protein
MNFNFETTNDCSGDSDGSGAQVASQRHPTCEVNWGSEDCVENWGGNLENKYRIARIQTLLINKNSHF